MGERDDRSINSFEAVVRHYFRHRANNSVRELEWFSGRPKSPIEAIKRASLSRIPSGRGAGQIRHPHQCHIPWAALVEASKRLVEIAPEIRACRDFESLHSLVEKSIRPIRGIGELATYDISHRIGVYLGCEPTTVYLHSGTKKGARALGLATNRKYIPIKELPKAFWRLSGAQAEDVLCIYRATLARLYGAKVPWQHSKGCAE